jgi:hypothetical protein
LLQFLESPHSSEHNLLINGAAESMAENLVVRNNPLLDIDSVDTENPRALEDDMADDEEPGSPTFDVLKTRDLTEFEEEDDAFPPWRQKAKEIDGMVPKMALSAIATILALFLADIRNWLLPGEAYDANRQLCALPRSVT